MVAGAVIAAVLALTSAQSARIDAVVAHVMRDQSIARCSIGASRDGGAVFARGYGGARVDAIYPIGSVTKEFTAALVLREIEEGRLRFDTREHGATVEQLLSQMSGIPNYAPGERTAEEALQEPLEFEPGSRWEYSNTNYVILGTLLTRLKGVPFAQLLHSEIIAPLGLAHTTTSTQGDVGMTSNVPDLLNWLHALDSGRVVNATDFLGMTSSAHLGDGTPTNYGYGFYVRDWYGWKAAETPGTIGDFSADVALVPDDHLAVAALCDRGPVSLSPLLKSIVAIIEPARNPALVATIGAPPENENPRVTERVKLLVAQLGLGTPRSIEFIQRTSDGPMTRERYRVSFDAAVYRMTLIYRDGTYVDATIGPDAPE